jgi:hypothetical protein
MSSSVTVKLLAGLAAFAAGIGAVVTAALLAHSTLANAGTSSTGPQAAPPATAASGPAPPSFPTPPPGALALAHEDRDLAVALAASPRAGKLLVQASIVGQEQPANGLSVAFRSDGHGSVPALSCGPGCYRATLAGFPHEVDVTLRGHDRRPSTVRFVLPASPPPGPSAAALVKRAETTWRRLRTLVVHDSLTSGPGTGIRTLWQFAAPNRLTYSISNGPQAVVIGTRRWDKVPGGRWQTSQADPIPEPVPLWLSVSDAHLLGSTVVRGRPAWEASFFDPQIHAWFTIWVEKSTMRTLELRMTAQAHFMHQVYGPFDAPVRIAPPARGTT